MRSAKEEMESGSGSEQAEDKTGNELESNEQQPGQKNKRYHRHTARQIQEMEAYVCFTLTLSLFSLHALRFHHCFS